MNIKTIAKPIADFVTHPRVIGPAVFVGIGATKTIKDCNDTPTDERTKILLKDLSILTGSVLAFSIANPLSKKFCNTAFFKTITNSIKKTIQIIRKKPITTNNVIKKTGEIIDKTEKIIKTTIAGTFNTLAGIVGAVLADTFMEKQVFSKPPFWEENTPSTKETISNLETSIIDTESKPTENLEITEETVKNNENEKSNYFKTSTIFNKFYYPNSAIAKQTANRVFSTVSDIPEMKMLSSPMIALTGFSVANTQGYDNKIKKTCYELLANTMIPTIFVATASMFTENKKAILKYPTLIVSLLLGAHIGKKTADSLQEKMNEKIDKIASKTKFM